MYIDDAAILKAAAELVAAWDRRQGLSQDELVRETINFYKKLKKEIEKE